jgi:PAP_fibrillin
MQTKLELLTAIAGKNRGILATESERRDILTVATQLEAVNPQPQPLQTPEKLGGDWELIYTTSHSLLGLDRLPFLSLGKVYQCLRPSQFRVYNIAEISGLPGLESIVSVVARFEPLSEDRIQVEFERSICGIQSLLGYQSPQQWIAEIETGKKFLGLDLPLPRSQRQAWLEITYLDQDLRISRGNEGSLFILTRT